MTNSTTRDLTQLDATEALQWHKESFDIITIPASNYLHGAFFLIDRDRLKKFLADAEVIIKEKRKQAEALFAENQENNIVEKLDRLTKTAFEDYMLAILVTVDKGKVGLLLTIADGAGDHVIDPGMGGYVWIENVSGNKFIAANETIGNLSFKVNTPNQGALRNNWVKPSDQFTDQSIRGNLKKTTELQKWLDMHKPDDCVKKYTAYIDRNASFYRNNRRRYLKDLAHISNLTSYISLWEFEEIFDKEFKSIGFFPIVMKSDTDPENEGFLPRKGEFVSFLSIPFKNSTESEAFAVAREVPMITTGKGYPVSWDQELLHKRTDNSDQKFDLHKF